jgi:hypothetical protein
VLDDLDRERPARLGIGGLIDPSHAAGACLADQDQALT